MDYSDRNHALIVGADTAFKATAEAARMSSAVKRCTGCNDPAPEYNFAGRCSFCVLGTFLSLGGASARQSFAHTGATAW